MRGLPDVRSPSKTSPHQRPSLTPPAIVALPIYSESSVSDGVLIRRGAREIATIWNHTDATTLNPPGGKENTRNPRWGQRRGTPASRSYDNSSETRFSSEEWVGVPINNNGAGQTANGRGIYFEHFRGRVWGARFLKSGAQGPFELTDLEADDRGRIVDAKVAGYSAPFDEWRVQGSMRRQITATGTEPQANTGTRVVISAGRQVTVFHPPSLNQTRTMASRSLHRGRHGYSCELKQEYWMLYS